MSMLIQALIGFLSSSAGNRIGRGVTNVVSIAALAPVALWLVEHKDEHLISLSYGEVAFIGGLLFVFLKLAHYTRAPGPADVAPWLRGGDPRE